jgi:hypothetical protein
MAGSDRSRAAWGWILVGCGSLVAAGVAGVIFLVVLFNRGSSDFEPLIDNFLNLVDQQAYDEAYRSIGDQWRKDDTFDEFRRKLARMSDMLGPHHSIKLNGVGYEKEFRSPASVRAEFSGAFEKGGATLRFILRRYGKEWKIDGLEFEKDGLEVAPPNDKV